MNDARSRKKTGGSLLMPPETASTEDRADSGKKPAVAIVGIACRFPGAPNREAFWQNLVNGVNSVREIPKSRWDTDLHYSPDIEETNRSISKWGGLLDRIDLFDNRFFNISPREARNMDPQQRVLLEETWHCIEDSGISPNRLRRGMTSVFVGVMTSDYHQVSCEPERVTDSYSALGNYDCILANRISYAFGFRGPSYAMDAAHASGLVAVHKARQALLAGESDFALVAGVNLNCHPWKYISFSKSRMLSPDGQCKTFDKDANGYVPGEGVGVLLMQRLETAKRAGNRIYGVIRGSAVNHGGQARSITVPRVEAQSDVILAAYESAGFSPETVTYVEAHGTGTSMGDPIEIEALTRAFRRNTERTGFCGIGSVKTNIGHLEAAAGIAGLIKVMLMMRHGIIPPSLNMRTLNPVIDFERSPFRVVTRARPWPPAADGLPIRAGVSSFGFGGTNAHVLVERVPARTSPEPEPDGDLIFALSAKTRNGLERLWQAWREFTATGPFHHQRMDEMTATLLTGRAAFPFRTGLIVRGKDHLATALREVPPLFTRSANQKWVIRLGHAGWTDRASLEELLAREPVVRERHDALNGRYSIWRKSHNLANDAAPDRTMSPLDGFIAGLACVEALIDMGLQPALILGESSGLWPALVLTGILQPEDVFSVLHGLTEPGSLTLNRPLFTFYDPVGQTNLLPFQIPAAYLEELFSNLTIEREASDRLFENGQIMSRQDPIFMSFLEQWQPALEARQLDLPSLWRESENATADPARRILLAMILEMAFQELRGHWDVRGKTRIQDPHFRECNDLLMDKVLCREDFVDLLLDPDPDWESASVLFNRRADRVSAEQPYPILRRYNLCLIEIENFSDWFDRAVRLSLPLPHQEPAFDFGMVNHPHANSIRFAISEDLASSFQKLLLTLWTHGVDLDWTKRFPETGFTKTELPAYPFDRQSFWLTKKSDADKAPAQVSPKNVEHDRIQSSNADPAAKNALETPKAAESKPNFSKDRQVNRPILAACKERLLKALRERLALSLECEPGELDDQASFVEDLGLDSFANQELVHHLEKLFGTLPSSLLFEYTSLQRLSDFFLERHPARVVNLFGDGLPDPTFADSVPVKENGNRVPAAPEANPDQHLLEVTAAYLKRMIAAGLGRDPSEIEDNGSFVEDYALDSFANQEMVQDLEKSFGPLPSTLLFEQTTIEKLSNFLANRFPSKLATLFDLPVSPRESRQETRGPDRGTDHFRPRTAPPDREEIAIIGLGGCFPGAANIHELWRRLYNGENCTGEVPPERWDWRDWYDPEGGPGKTHTRWGGFLDRFDRFDPLFFKISPWQAELMDPQQRVFLETAWATVEDAGYVRERLGNEVGVFVGVCTNYYDSWAMQESLKGNIQCPDVDHYDIANRVSYFFDFNGPSMTVDTACSSSLTAVNLAVNSLRLGECRVALAGGVSLTLHPRRVVQFSQKGMLIADDHCHPFGDGKGGFVDAEGAASILLKPLSQALADGDHIYGVVRGMALNAGGRTSGYTVPNPKIQGELVSRAIETAGIDARTIGYIEAHGTGTRLGDPIEVDGLTRAFRRHTEDKGFCAIGSIKSNIGHLIAAAGIAGLTKVLLQMKYQTLVPSLFADPPNPKIKFEETPFTVQKQSAPWQRMIVDGQPVPRRAGVSSFGAGGANAHILIEEFENPAAEPAPRKARLVVLSARDEDRLRAKAVQLAAYLTEHGAVDPDKVEAMRRGIIEMAASIRGMDPADLDPEPGLDELGFDRVCFSGLVRGLNERWHTEICPGLWAAHPSINDLVRMVTGRRGDFAGPSPSLDQVAWTLQTGREAMAERLAVVATDLTGLVEQLRLFNRGEAGIWLHGRTGENNRAPVPNDFSDLGTAASAWVTGTRLDWERLWPDKTKPARVSLPAYPFAGERYWIPVIEEPSPKEKTVAGLTGHPFFAGTGEVRFRHRLDRARFWFADHVVGGRPILPGVAYLELARTAAARIVQGPASLGDVLWLQPLDAGAEDNDPELILGRDENDQRLRFSVESAAGVHAEGILLYDHPPEPVIFDLESKRAELTACWDRETCYVALWDRGFSYGPAFQPLQDFYPGPGEALAHLVLPNRLNDDFSAFELHPTLLDGALQSVLLLVAAENAETYLPFALDRLDLVAPLTKEAWVHVLLDPGFQADSGVINAEARLYGPDGRELARFTGISFRALPKESTETVAEPAEVTAHGTQTDEDHETDTIHYLVPDWEPVAEDNPSEPEGPILVLGYDDKRFASLAEHWSGNLVLVEPGPGFDGETDRFLIDPERLESWQKLLTALAESDRFPRTILHLWPMKERAPGKLTPERLIQNSSLGLTALFLLVKALFEYDDRPVQLIGAVREDMPEDVALSGFLRTAILENESLAYRLIRCADGTEWPNIRPLLTHARNDTLRIDDRGVSRSVLRFTTPETLDLEPDRLRQKGVYLITGGSGGLGEGLALFLAEHFAARLILIGRSPFSKKILSGIKAIKARGGDAVYIRADAADEQQIRNAVQNGTCRFGAVNGVFHCAGLLRDKLIFNKELEDVDAVLTPKLRGTLLLDRVTRDQPLDFFVLFSSITALLGNSGQCDYTYANAFLDAFSGARNRSDAPGHTLSVNWPLWDGGGMKIDTALLDYWTEHTGTVPLTLDSGWRALCLGLRSRQHQLLPAPGNRTRLRRVLTPPLETLYLPDLDLGVSRP